jgi:hypothetical protein
VVTRERIRIHVRWPVLAMASASALDCSDKAGTRGGS